VLLLDVLQYLLYDLIDCCDNRKPRQFFKICQYKSSESWSKIHDSSSKQMDIRH